MLWGFFVYKWVILYVIWSEFFIMSFDLNNLVLKCIGIYDLIGNWFGKGNFVYVELVMNCIIKSKVCYLIVCFFNFKVFYKWLFGGLIIVIVKYYGCGDGILFKR